MAAVGGVHDSGVIQSGVPAEHAQWEAGIARAGRVARVLVRFRAAVHADAREAGPMAGPWELIVAMRYYTTKES